VVGVVVSAVIVVLMYRRWRSGGAQYTHVAQFNAVYEGLEHAADGVIGEEANRDNDEDDELLSVHDEVASDEGDVDSGEDAPFLK
jgi:hypothetical protein